MLRSLVAVDGGWTVGARRPSRPPVGRPRLARMPLASCRPARRSALVVMLLAVGLVASGCSLLEGPAPEVPVREAPPRPESVPSVVPGGDAQENLPAFTEVLRDFAAGSQPIEGRPVVDAVAAAGFDRSAMQVSLDRSKTNLVADSLFVSVRLGDECLIGQLVSEDRSFAVDAAPSLGPDGTVCLLGTTRPIDW